MQEASPNSRKVHISAEITRVGFETFLNKFERFNRVVSGGFEWIGVAGLLTIAAITCIDIVGSKVFLRPVPGSVDINGFSQIIAIAFAIAFTEIIGRHVRVEFFVSRLPRHAQGIINSFTSLLTLALFILIVWRSYELGQTLQSAGHTSLSARIPLYPFAYAISFASIPVCLIFLVEFLRSVAQVIKR